MREWWFEFRLKWFCHRLAWHVRPYASIGCDGCSEEAMCTRCGYKGLVDSQGNLF